MHSKILVAAVDFEAAKALATRLSRERGLPLVLRGRLDGFTGFVAVVAPSSLPPAMAARTRLGARPVVFAASSESGRGGEARADEGKRSESGRGGEVRADEGKRAAWREIWELDDAKVVREFVVCPAAHAGALNRYYNERERMRAAFVHVTKPWFRRQLIDSLDFNRDIIIWGTPADFAAAWGSAYATVIQAPANEHIYRRFAIAVDGGPSERRLRFDELDTPELVHAPPRILIYAPTLAECDAAVAAIVAEYAARHEPLRFATPAMMARARHWAPIDRVFYFRDITNSDLNSLDALVAVLDPRRAGRCQQLIIDSTKAPDTPGVIVTCSCRLQELVKQGGLYSRLVEWNIDGIPPWRGECLDLIVSSRVTAQSTSQQALRIFGAKSLRLPPSAAGLYCRHVQRVSVVDRQALYVIDQVAARALLASLLTRGANVWVQPRTPSSAQPRRIIAARWESGRIWLTLADI